MKLIPAFRIGPLAFALGLAGCARPGNMDPSGVFADPAAYRGQTVTLDASFQGYLVDACRFAPGARSVSLSRSDWLVRQNGNCLYVTGDPPTRLDPVDPGSIGRRVELRATVIDDGSQNFLLQALEVRTIDP
jgi:hypothetical protein